MNRMGLALALLMFVSANVDGGWFSKKKVDDEVPGAHPDQMVTPNGVVVPKWASRRIAESPVPLYGKSWGRRPWALALSTQATPSAVYARAYQMDFGAGPVPGYTNGPGLAGNVASAPVGPGNGYGWGPPPGIRNVFAPPLYPYTTGLAGY